MKKLIFLFLLFPLVLAAQDGVYHTEECAVNALLPGTLYLPDGPGEHPLVILHAGSGPTDRNGNQQGVENNSLKFLAEELAKRNIAVYTYDKRMFALVKREYFDESKLLFEDFISDAAEVIAHFKKDHRFTKIIPAGHSEGSLICMVAAEKSAADAFISISGPGNSIDVVLEDQISQQAPILLDEVEKSLAILKAGDTLSTVHPMLYSLFRPSVQPYMISWLKYNPQEEIKKLHIPVLIVSGSKDLQVNEKEAELLKTAYPNAELSIIKDMNHVLKIISGDEKENMASYNNPDLPVAEELVKTIVDFVERNR